MLPVLYSRKLSYNTRFRGPSMMWDAGICAISGYTTNLRPKVILYVHLYNFYSRVEFFWLNQNILMKSKEWKRISSNVMTFWWWMCISYFLSFFVNSKKQKPFRGFHEVFFCNKENIKLLFLHTFRNHHDKHVGVQYLHKNRQQLSPTISF